MWGSEVDEAYVYEAGCSGKRGGEEEEKSERGGVRTGRRGKNGTPDDSPACTYARAALAVV